MLIGEHNVGENKLLFIIPTLYITARLGNRVADKGIFF